MTHQQTKISKTISYALRHRPDEFGLRLDAEGWVSIEDLTKAASSNLGFAISREDIEEIIVLSEKKRFEISGNRIRATYGHSFDSKIEFKPVEPPEFLYHGTSERAFKIIEKGGLKPMGRQYVHLSSDFDTAKTVGLRHDRHKVYVIFVDAEQMHKDKYEFFHSGNDGTWMCASVPPKYFKRTIIVQVGKGTIARAAQSWEKGR